MHPGERPLIWSEEEMCWLEPTAPVRRGPRSLAHPLRQELGSRPVATPHEVTRSSIIHTPTVGRHGNFTDLAYRRILARPEWARRLSKAHTAKRKARPQGPDEETRAWCELDAATSSDALLMNVFCYPRVLAGHALPALLGVERGLEPEFGYHPRTPLLRGLKDRTEIDMRLGNLLVEAKLTEAGFAAAPLRKLERYAGAAEVFDLAALTRSDGAVENYQLLRGVLAAHAVEGRRFALFADARRADLLDAWACTVAAVQGAELRTRLSLLTWQEMARVLPAPLREFLSAKYGIG